MCEVRKQGPNDGGFADHIAAGTGNIDPSVHISVLMFVLTGAAFYRCGDWLGDGILAGDDLRLRLGLWELDGLGGLGGSSGRSLLFKRDLANAIHLGVCLFDRMERAQ